MNGKQEMIRNKAFLACEMCGKTYVFESNEVIAKKIDIRVIKEQSCNVYLSGDKLGYKVTICNDSCMDICDLNFRDRLDSGMIYEKNSFKVNGECKNPELIGQNLCYRINRLRAKEEIVITFAAEAC